MNVNSIKTQYELTKLILNLVPLEEKMTAAEKTILVQLSFFCDSRRSCYPSHSKLAKLTGFSKSTVIRALDKLIELNFIQKKRRSNKYGSTSNLYELLPKFKSKKSMGEPATSSSIPFVAPDGRVFNNPTEFYRQGDAL